MNRSPRHQEPASRGREHGISPSTISNSPAGAAAGLAEAVQQGGFWIRKQRAHHRPACRSLSLAEIRAYEPQFSPNVLEQVRIGVPTRLPRPSLAHLSGSAHLKKLLDFRAVEAITLADTILLSRTAMPPPARIRTLLFHELVHVLQFRLLACRGFLWAYLGGWMDSGCHYRAIPLERVAFELEKQYAAGHLPAQHLTRREVCPS